MKTKKHLSLVMLLCIGGMFGHAPLWAKKVEVAKAETVVRNHLQAESMLRSSGKLQLQLAKTAVRQRSGQQLRSSANETVCYYVFNVTGGSSQGFVIVAGDDIARPVLGYSDSSTYDDNNLPPNFVYWMDGLSQQIATAVENNLPQSTEIQAEWDSYMDGNSLRVASPVVGPLLQTQWDQSPIYNDLCPPINGKKTYTGCLATAMAQVMKYHNHPARGTGSSEAYTTETEGISIPAVSFNVNYDWGNMINDYYGWETHIITTDAQNTAVATLMYHCGVSVRMDYRSDGSGGKWNEVPKALTTYFGYDNSIANKRRVYYDDSDWDAMLQAQLDTHLPILYYGNNNVSAHAFVCDGYDNAGKFHFNWGWGGHLDGYFVTTALNPKDDAGYSDDQEIIINIKPDEGGVPPSYELKLFEDMTSSAIAVNRGEAFIVTTSWVNRARDTDFSGETGIAIVNNDDVILEIIGGYSIARDDGVIVCVVSSAIIPGSYKLRTVVKPTGGNDWEIVTGFKASIVDKLDITVNEAIVPDNSDLKLYNNPAFVLTPNPITQGSPLEVRFGLINEGTGGFIGELELGLYDADNNLVEVIDKRTLSTIIDPYYRYNIFYSSSIQAAAGTYTLTLYQKAAMGERKKVANYYNIFLNDMEVTVIGSTAVTGITLKTTASLAVNGTEQLIATVQPTNATNKNVTWTSNSNAVATVDNAGWVTAHAAGLATIKATTADGSKTATCVVTVTSGTAIDDIDKGKILIISVSNGIVIETTEATLVSIFNILGQKVHQSVVDGSAEIRLSKGVYIVRANRGSQKVIVK